MKKMFKCIDKGFHLTPGKNYLISLNTGKSSIGMHHTLYSNDIGKDLLIFEDEQKIRNDKLNELGI